MDIADLQQFAVGEWVNIDDGIVGVVVFNAARGEWSAKYPETLYPRVDNDGIMICQSNGALVFHGNDYFVEHAGRIRRHDHHS